MRAAPPARHRRATSRGPLPPPSRFLLRSSSPPPSRSFAGDRRCPLTYFSGTLRVLRPSIDPRRPRRPLPPVPTGSLLTFLSGRFLTMVVRERPVGDSLLSIMAAQPRTSSLRLLWTRTGMQRCFRERESPLSTTHRSILRDSKVRNTSLYGQLHTRTFPPSEISADRCPVCRPSSLEHPARARPPRSTDRLYKRSIKP